MNKKFKIKHLVSLPSSTYHTIRYDSKTIFVGGSDWNREKIPKSQKENFAKGVLFRICQDNVETLHLDSDMIYCVNQISNNLLFLGAKTEKNSFQIFSIKDKKIIKQKDDPKGLGCYETLFIEEKKELLMSTRNGYLQIVDVKTLSIKESTQITKTDRLWSILFVDKKDIIFASDYAGNLYKIRKKGLKVIKKISLLDLYKHKDNHSNYPSLWGLSYFEDIIISGDRFGGITIWDEDLNMKDHLRIKKDLSTITDPKLRLDSSEVESIMSVAIIDKNNFLAGTRWGNVLLINKDKKIEKIISVPMGIQKENSAFTMNKSSTSKGDCEVLITFGDGQIYSISFTKKD